MALIEINWNPSRRDLRLFAGLWFPLFLLIVGGLVWYSTKALPVALGFGAAAGVVSLTGLLKPVWVRPLFTAWMCLAYPIGWTVVHGILAAIFFLVMTPIGFVMRRLGRDPMERRFDRAAETYWVPHNPGADAARYFRQF